MSADRGQFSSKLGFILAAAGSAVGLGNLAAFPVGAAKNGGAAFLILYIVFVAFICFPIMIAELGITGVAVGTGMGVGSSSVLKLCQFN